MDPRFICCNNPGNKGLSLSLKTCQKLRRNHFFLFCTRLSGSKESISCTPSKSKITDDVTPPLFTDQLLGCDASILANDGISMVQHLRANSCDKMASAKQNHRALLFLFCKPSLF
jgi:hypothetical protein